MCKYLGFIVPQRRGLARSLVDRFSTARSGSTVRPNDAGAALAAPHVTLAAIATAGAVPAVRAAELLIVLAAAIKQLVSAAADVPPLRVVGFVAAAFRLLHARGAAATVRAFHRAGTARTRFQGGSRIGLAAHRAGAALVDAGVS